MEQGEIKLNLLEKIHKEFPSLVWEKAIFSDEGLDHFTIILDEKIVFRFPKKNQNIEKTSNEINLLQYLNSHISLPIPDCKWIPQDRSFFGYTSLSGHKLSVSYFETLDRENRDFVITQLAKFISELHSTPQSVCEQLKVLEQNTRQEFNNLVRTTNQCVLPKLSSKEKTMAEKYFSQLAKTLHDSLSKVLIHGDLRESNLLWSESERTLKIIDFSDILFGDTAIEFSRMLVYGDDFLRQVYNLYSGLKDKNLLNRARLRFKGAGIRIMNEAKNDSVFKIGHTLFRKRFFDQDTKSSLL